VAKSLEDHIRMISGGLAGIVVVSLLIGGLAVTAGQAASAQTSAHSGFPVDIVAGPAPRLVHASGHPWLLYELHVTNFAPLAVNLTEVEVLGDSKVLLTYSGQALQKIAIPVEELSTAASPPSSSSNGQTIGPGHAAILFVNVELPDDAAVPVELRHRFSVSVTRSNGEVIQTTVTGVVVPIIKDSVPVVSAPLRGKGWIAFNALGAADHRRSLNAVDGRERIPQRFAIDWMQLGPDGKLFHGDTKSNASYYGYGAEVLAVADGQVSDMKDGLEENAGSTERRNRVVTLDNVLGNYIILDLGHSRFAVYAHLRPGTLMVKLGDRVKAGQVLARLGNSGNSDAPHLHFQLVDGNSGLAAEGIPYELASFIHLGFAEDEDALEAGQPWRSTNPAPAAQRSREFPSDKQVVDLP